MKLRTVLYGIAALMVAIGLVGFLQARDETNSPARQNLAMTDAALTAEVQSSATQGLGQVLTYDYRSPEATSAAADQVLTGSARSQYDTLFQQLQEKAPGQKLVLQAEVKGVAVKTLSSSSAAAVVFVDQTSQRATDKESSTSAAQLAISLKKNSDGAWQISSLEPL